MTALDYTAHSALFATAEQLDADDMAAARADGFATVVCNRPDFEGGADQPTIEVVGAAARAAGLTFVALPFAGAQLSPELARDFALLLHDAPKPILAYCRTGTRSGMIYRLAVDLGYLREADLACLVDTQ